MYSYFADFGRINVIRQPEKRIPDNFEEIFLGVKSFLLCGDQHLFIGSTEKLLNYPLPITSLLISMKLKELIVVLRIASERSAGLVLFAKANLKDNFSKSQAYKIYGRSNVDRWMGEGLISLSNNKINRDKLEAIAASSNRVTYLPVAER